MNKLVISEHFYSIQGEGKYIGYPAVFLRLGGCNLKCGFRDKTKNNLWICDTKEVWTKSTSYTIEQLLDLFETEGYINHLINGANLVITGGEPLLQEEALTEFLEKIRWIGNFFSNNTIVEVETNGTIYPSANLSSLVKIFNISPKLESSNEPREKRKLKFILNKSDRIDYIYKFVISDFGKDVLEVINFISNNNLDKNKIYLMPSGETKTEMEKNILILTNYCKRYNFKLSTRLHISIYDKKTGV